MKIDPLEVGKRIKAAREAAGLRDCAALAGKIFQNSKKKGRTKASPETVRLWEAGKHIPPWDKIDQLREILGIDEEELLFGQKRDSQLRSERPRLVYLTALEADLIVVFRHASQPAQKRILATAQSLADDDPAPTADFHLLKSK